MNTKFTLAVVVMAAGIIVWGVRLEGRVGAVERSTIATNTRLDVLVGDWKSFGMQLAEINANIKVLSNSMTTLEKRGSDPMQALQRTMDCFDAKLTEHMRKDLK